MVSLLIISRSQAQKDLKRNRVIAICGIECGGFRIESHVCAQAKLPGVFMAEVALSAQGVRSDPVSRMDGRSPGTIHPCPPTPAG